MDGLQPFHSFLLSLRSLSPFCFTTTFLLEPDNIKRLPAQTHLRAGSIFILPPSARRYDISATKSSFEGVRRRRGAAAWWTVVPREGADRAARARFAAAAAAVPREHIESIWHWSKTIFDIIDEAGGQERVQDELAHSTAT